MSGSLNQVNKFIKEKGINNIEVIDSMQNSSAQGSIVKSFNNNEFTNVEDFKVFVNVNDITTMNKSGRLSNSKYSMLKLFSLGAIVTIKNGSGSVSKLISTKSDPVKNLLKIIKGRNISNIVISYTTNPKNGIQLKHALQNEYKNITLVQTSNIVSGFAGSDALSIGFKEA